MRVTTNYTGSDPSPLTTGKFPEGTFFHLGNSNLYIVLSWDEKGEEAYVLDISLGLRMTLDSESCEIKEHYPVNMLDITFN